MEVFAKVTGVSGKKLEIELDEDAEVNNLFKYSAGSQPILSVKFDDNRKISNDQRKKIFAILNDISDWTGFSPMEAEIAMQHSFLSTEETKDYFKFEYMLLKNVEYFSFSNCSMSLAAAFLTHIIDFCFEFKIPFKTKSWDAIPTDYPRMQKALEQRICVLCGDTADIAHYDTVGIGNNRTKDSRTHYLMPLCRIHHSEQHNIGVITFCNKHHFKPVKITAETYHRLIKHEQITWTEEIKLGGSHE